jgi:hypothetical protein
MASPKSKLTKPIKEKRGQAFMGFLTLVQLLIVPLVKGVVTSYV